MMMHYKPKVKAVNPQHTAMMQNILQSYRLNSVCEAAACPNRAECYARSSATFMILGDVCTRACSFCNVKTGHGMAVDEDEPLRLAEAVRSLGLRYVVLTSVDRDDLKDYGAHHFAKCVAAIKEYNPGIKIELLTPDFRNDTAALEVIVASDVDKLAHNQETVRRVSKHVRAQSDYERSLQVLRYYAKNSRAVVKSSLMVGLGESEEELRETMRDLLEVGVRQLTIGQYLQPTPKHHPVVQYFSEDFFSQMKEEALEMGFDAVASGILVRSSYFAEELELKQK